MQVDSQEIRRRFSARKLRRRREGKVSGVFCLFSKEFCTIINLLENNIRKICKDWKVNSVAADLHCHTKMSDGSASIDEVVLMAKKLGLKTIAVTDHDTFAGATRACVYGRRQGIEVIHGAEISCIDSARGRKVHILCYLCQNPDRLEGVFKRTKERRQRAAALMLPKGDAPVSYHAGHGFRRLREHQHLISSTLCTRCWTPAIPMRFRRFIPQAIPSQGRGCLCPGGIS